jgi:hypothetical protein
MFNYEGLLFVGPSILAVLLFIQIHNHHALRFAYAAQALAVVFRTLSDPSLERVRTKNNHIGPNPGRRHQREVRVVVCHGTG